MSKLLIYTILITSCFFTISCSYRTRGSYVNFNTNFVKSENPKVASEIEVFYKEKPSAKYSEIGIVEAVTYGDNLSLQSLYPELKKQAAMMGADAIYKIELQNYSHAGQALHATAIGIKFKE